MLPVAGCGGHRVSVAGGREGFAEMPTFTIFWKSSMYIIKFRICKICVKLNKIKCTSLIMIVRAGSSGLFLLLFHFRCKYSVKNNLRKNKGVSKFINKLDSSLCLLD